MAAVVIGLLAGSAAAPAAAQHSGPLDLVAFGDSYTAGIGAPEFKLSPLYPATQCAQASPGYADVLAQRGDVRLAANAACAGWTAAMVPGQVNVVAAAGLLNAETDLATITAGANDVNFLSALQACMTRTEEECRTAVNAAEAVAESVVFPVLANAYAVIGAQAPNATIAALGYPHLFSPELGDSPYITDEAAEIFNAGTDTLNKVIRNAAKSAGAVFVEVTDDFAGHGIGSPDPWIIFNPAAPAAPVNFHPTAAGYAQGYAAAVVEEAEIAELSH